MNNYNSIIIIIIQLLIIIIQSWINSTLNLTINSKLKAGEIVVFKIRNFGAKALDWSPENNF